MYYAVANGRKNGIFSTWDECKKSVIGFKGAKYKKFSELIEAKYFVANNGALINKKDEKEVQDNVDYYVYTDGSCINNGKKNAKAGMGIYFGKNDPRNFSKRVVGKQSNNTGELGAIYNLYNIIKNDIANNKKITIVTDSKYAIRCITSYGQKCDNDGWTKDIPNKELVKKTFNLYKDKNNVNFIYIKAHTGKTDKHSIGNENADRLAYAAILK